MYLFHNLIQERSFASYIRHLKLSPSSSSTILSVEAILQITTCLPLLQSLEIMSAEVSVGSTSCINPSNQPTLHSLSLRWCRNVQWFIPTLIHIFRPQRLGLFNNSLYAQQEFQLNIGQFDTISNFPLQTLELSDNHDPQVVNVLRSIISPTTLNTIIYSPGFWPPSPLLEHELFIHARASLRHLELRILSRWG